jgi:hypothetical protein
MKITPVKLRLAQAEVHHAAHSQDLTEIQKQATFEREAEGLELKPIPKSRVPL